MTGKLRVGIVGCEEVTQAVHRPTLLGLADMFAITACTDSWEEGAQSFAQSTGARVWSDPLEMIADESVDVVLVAAPDAYHAEYVIAACQAGKKGVLVEKPLTMNVRMAKEIKTRVTGRQTPIIVAYPHLFDPAVAQAERQWGKRAPMLGEFRTILGPNAQFVSDTAQPQRPSVPESATAKMMQYALAASEPLGSDIGLADIMSYGYAIGLNIHDIPVMRRLLGEPDEITFAERFESNGLHVGFRYGTGRVYLTSISCPEREIDWGFTLRARDGSVSVRYPSTYAPSAASECTTSCEVDGGVERRTWEGSYVTGFRREWQHVHALAHSGADSAESIADAIRDLELCEEIVRSLPK